MPLNGINPNNIDFDIDLDNLDYGINTKNPDLRDLDKLIQQSNEFNTIAGRLKDLEIPPPVSALPIAYMEDPALASHSYEVLKKRIKEFEDQLDADHEVAMKLASFGSSVTLSVRDIGYSNPNTLVFYGLVNGNESILIQHMSQLNFLLVSVPKADPKAPARRIGFLSSEESEKSE